MKVIRCEMCGGNDLIKQDGFFVCQSCGIKYSLEEAKKLMVEGTVKIDKTDEVQNLLKRAFMHLEEGKWADADALLDQILNQAPENAQAYVGKLMLLFKLKREEELGEIPFSFDKNINYERIMQFGDDKIKEKIAEYNKKENPIGSIDQLALSKDDFYGKAKQLIITDEKLLAYDESANEPIKVESVIVFGVSKIPNKAFFEWKKLNKVVVLDTLKHIEEYAFAGCTSLKIITLPSSLKRIDYHAFDNAPIKEMHYQGSIKAWNKIDLYDTPIMEHITKSYFNGKLLKDSDADDIFKRNFSFDDIKSIKIPATMKKLRGFSGNTSLKCIEIPDTVISIDGFAFADCTSLTSITIPNSVTEIGNSAFNNCTSLKRIDIPDSVTSIAWWAFKGCKSLKRINIPDSVTHIEVNAFEGCTSLTSITIPSSVTSISNALFIDCISLTSITIPDSVTSIGGSAFKGCTSLTSITIPSSVTSIGLGAFADCTSLTSITIPDSVTSIDNFAFKGCTSLTSITIPDSVTSIGRSAFEGCTSLTSITIPNSVTSIDWYAFKGCKSLEKLIIPDSITSIHSSAVTDCTYSLLQIEYQGTTKQWEELVNPTSIFSSFSPRHTHCVGDEIIKAREEAERKAREEAERKVREEVRQKQAWKKAGLCQHCGGSFKGIFTKTCSICGIKKDY